MKQRTFTDPRGREIVVEVSKNHILFFYRDDIDRHYKWLSEQTELGNEVPEEQRDVNEFYWIETNQWVADKTQRLDRGDNWHFHMKEKNWFTDEMYEFINSQTGKLTDRK